MTGTTCCCFSPHISHDCSRWVPSGICCCRFTALQDLIPQKEKVDKATILTQVVDYIRQVQVGCALRLARSCPTCKARQLFGVILAGAHLSQGAWAVAGPC